MVKRCPQTYETYEDRLVKRWFCRCHGERSQGKRITNELQAEMFVGGNDIRRIYVDKGKIQAIKVMYFALRDGCDLRWVKDKFDSWLGTPRVIKRTF